MKTGALTTVVKHIARATTARNARTLAGLKK